MSEEQTIAERSAEAIAAKAVIDAERAEALTEILASEEHQAAVEALRSLYDTTDAYNSLNRQIGNAIQSLDSLSATANYVPPAYSYVTPAPQ